MKKPEETKKPAVNHLKNLKSFLKEEFKSEPEEIKPPMMDYNEMENFFKQKVIPVFKKLEKELLEFKFDSVDYELHTRVAKLKIASTFSLYYFSVAINNANRHFKISYSLKYRYQKKKKLFVIEELESKTIAFADIDTINDELLLSLCTKWYMAKNETIEKDKEEQRNS